jgi:hypothetical protein
VWQRSGEETKGKKAGKVEAHREIDFWGPGRGEKARGSRSMAALSFERLQWSTAKGASIAVDSVGDDLGRGLGKVEKGLGNVLA